MEIKTVTVPQMLTVKEVAATGILPEHALRYLLKNGQLPAVFTGKKALINYTALVDYLNTLKPTF